MPEETKEREPVYMRAEALRRKAAGLRRHSEMLRELARRQIALLHAQRAQFAGELRRHSESLRQIAGHRIASLESQRARVAEHLDRSRTTNS